MMMTRCYDYQAAAIMFAKLLPPCCYAAAITKLLPSCRQLSITKRLQLPICCSHAAMLLRLSSCFHYVEKLLPLSWR
jgi:hypothetical protein